MCFLAMVHAAEDLVRQVDADLPGHSSVNSQSMSQTDWTDICKAEGSLLGTVLDSIEAGRYGLCSYRRLHSDLQRSQGQGSINRSSFGRVEGSPQESEMSHWVRLTEQEKGDVRETRG